MKKVISLPLVLSCLALNLYGMEKIRTGETAALIAKKYIKITENFGCQEEIRRMDLAIKDMVTSEVGKNKGDQFSLNGWGTILAAALAKEQKNLCNPSEGFSQFIEGKINAAIKLAQTDPHHNPFKNSVVRGPVKDLLMSNPGNYSAFQKTDFQTPIEELNKLLPQEDLIFDLAEGKLFLKINSKGEGNIFTKLWKTNFKQQLEQHSYHHMGPNRDMPHITLVSSNVIGQIKEDFIKRYQQNWQTEFNSFMNTFISRVNAELKSLAKQIEHHEESLPALKEGQFKFTQLVTTYSEDYPVFGHVVIAKFAAPTVTAALKELVTKVKDDLGITIKTTPEEAYHLTIAADYREPRKLPYKSMDDLIEHTGSHKESFMHYWNQFKIEDQ